MNIADRAFIGESEAVKKVKQTISKIAASEATILILGESGTGKELAAKSIHAASLRNPHPFVAINCGAIPENLMESELFGHEKGAFTGAVERKIGKFQLANNGTLFLDEIGELPPGGVNATSPSCVLISGFTPSVTKLSLLMEGVTTRKFPNFL